MMEEINTTQLQSQSFSNDISTHLKKLQNINFYINDNDIKIAEKKGINLYKNNNVLRDLATFMENPESYTFYKKYLENSHYSYHMMCMIKVYEIITGILNKKTHTEFNAYHKLFLLYSIINNPKYNYLIFKKLIT